MLFTPVFSQNVPHQESLKMELRQNKNFLPVYKRSNAMWRETSEKRVVLYRLLVCFSCTNRLLSCKNEKALIFFCKTPLFLQHTNCVTLLGEIWQKSRNLHRSFFFNKTHAVVSENCWNALLQQIWSFFESFLLCITCRNVCRIFCTLFCNIIMRLNCEFIVYLWKRRYRQQRRVYWCSGIFSPRVSVVIVFIFLKIPNKESLFEGTW